MGGGIKYACLNLKMRKCWPYGFNTTWYGSQWRQWEQYDKFKIGRFIKFGKESPSRRDKILRRYQTIRKRESHQARKDFNQKKKRERKEWMQEFSSSCERILIQQKKQEIWDSMKDHSSWEGWAKMKIHQEEI